jgi:hypothetical protein
VLHNHPNPKLAIILPASLSVLTVASPVARVSAGNSALARAANTPPLPRKHPSNTTVATPTIVAGHDDDNVPYNSNIAVYPTQ